MKILTFIIPAYNSAAYLDKCVSSMLAPQVLDKLEIIIVNDGSADATQEIAQRYCVCYPGTVRLISQENRGHGGALNAGCAAAQGKYLKAIDADDWVETQSLPELTALLENCSSDVVLTHYRTMDIRTGVQTQWPCYPEAFGKPWDLEYVTANWARFRNGLTFHGILYRTDFYQQYGLRLPEHVFYEDHEFATFPCCHAGSLICFDLYLYNYRIGDGDQSISEKNQIKRIRHLEAVFRHMAQAYQPLPEGSGRHYAAIKLQGVLLSYLTTALLSDPDRREGRLLAKEIMARCREFAPEVCKAAEKKYVFFYAMNRLHMNRKAWNRILESHLYRRLRSIR